MRPVRATLAAAILIATVTLVTQDPPARGRGASQPPPNPLGQPLLDPAGKIRDEAVIHTPLAGADARYADLDGGRMKEILEDFVAISDRNRAAGDVFWGRN